MAGRARFAGLQNLECGAVADTVVGDGDGGVYSPSGVINWSSNGHRVVIEWSSSVVMK